MFSLKNRFLNEINCALNSFGIDFNQNSTKLSDLDLQRLDSFPKKIEEESLKGLAIGSFFGIFFLCKYDKYYKIEY